MYFWPSLWTGSRSPCTTAASGIHVGELSDAFGDFMVRTGSVATDPEATDNLAIFIERHAATSSDNATSDLVVTTTLPRGGSQKLGVETIRWVSPVHECPGWTKV